VFDQKLQKISPMQSLLL